MINRYFFVCMELPLKTENKTAVIILDIYFLYLVETTKKVLKIRVVYIVLNQGKSTAQPLHIILVLRTYIIWFLKLTM